MATDRRLFLNLPVRDLEASTAFFGTLGFAFDAKFTDQSAACMIISEQACAMFTTRNRFGGFTSKPVADPAQTAQAIICLSADDRAGVDALADAALASGGTPAMPAQDHGFMYGRSFNDLDGHQWEVVWMDSAAMEQGPAEFTQNA